MWYMRSDGWRDESDEGPYIELLHTKERWSIHRNVPSYRSSSNYILRNWAIDLRMEFETVEEAKEYVNSR